MVTAKMHRALGWQRRNTYSIVHRQLSNNRNLFLPDGSRVPFNLWALIGPKSGSEKDILPLPQRMAALTRLLYRWGSNIDAFETKCITNLKVWY